MSASLSFVRLASSTSRRLVKIASMRRSFPSTQLRNEFVTLCDQKIPADDLLTGE